MQEKDFRSLVELLPLDVLEEILEKFEKGGSKLIQKDEGRT